MLSTANTSSLGREQGGLLVVTTLSNRNKWLQEREICISLLDILLFVMSRACFLFTHVELRLPIMFAQKPSLYRDMEILVSQWRDPTYP